MASSITKKRTNSCRRIVVTTGVVKEGLSPAGGVVTAAYVTEERKVAGRSIKEAGGVAL